MTSNDSQPSKPCSATLKQDKTVQNYSFFPWKMKNFRSLTRLLSPEKRAWIEFLGYIYLELS